MGRSKVKLTVKARPFLDLSFDFWTIRRDPRIWGWEKAHLWSHFYCETWKSFKSNQQIKCSVPGTSGWTWSTVNPLYLTLCRLLVIEWPLLVSRRGRPGWLSGRYSSFSNIWVSDSTVGLQIKYTLLMQRPLTQRPVHNNIRLVTRHNEKPINSE